MRGGPVATGMRSNTYGRRTALRYVGALLAASGLTATASAQENESETEEDEEANDGDDGGDRLPIVLAGRAEYWYGVSPEAIEGEENPTLELEDGEEYEIVWINVDGTEHDLVVEDADGEELESSDATETPGEAITMTFEASDEMAEYYCEYHPEDMRGDVELGEEFDLGGHEHDHEDNASDEGGNGDDADGDDGNGSDVGY